MGTKAIEAWKCTECGSVCMDEDEANECCKPRIIEGYVCGGCYEFYVDESKALACCPADEVGTPLVSALELEAAGQMRLIG